MLVGDLFFTASDTHETHCTVYCPGFRFNINLTYTGMTGNPRYPVSLDTSFIQEGLHFAD